MGSATVWGAVDGGGASAGCAAKQMTARTDATAETPSGQVKSRRRVADYGEVFTAEREVNAMLDLVANEAVRIESRFLEPACGDGNFLAEILRRKLAEVARRYGGARSDFEMWSILAVMSIYGVELLADNAAACRKRLFAIWDAAYVAHCKDEVREVCREAVRHILAHNILCGDALTLKQQDGSPIVFAEWAFATGTKVKRRDFRLDVLLAQGEKGRPSDQTFDFFGGANAAVNWMPDPDDATRQIPAPTREYPPVDYWRVQEYE